MPVRKRKDRRRHAVPDWKTEIDLDIGWLSDRSDDEEIAELRRDWSDMPVEQRPRFLDAGKELPWTPF